MNAQATAKNEIDHLLNQLFQTMHIRKNTFESGRKKMHSDSILTSGYSGRKSGTAPSFLVRRERTGGFPDRRRLLPAACFWAAWLLGCLLFAAPAKAQEKTTLKIMSFNLRFGERASLEELGIFIRNERPDIVMLQEVDVCTRRERAPGRHDKNFIARLGYYTEMFGAYGKTIPYKGGYYGIGLLSRYPLIRIERYLLPKPEENREQRALLVARAELDDGEEITVACTHLDLKPEIRRIQVDSIDARLRREAGMVWLGGDFNARPDAPEIAGGMRSWRKSCRDTDFTLPAEKPKAKIDYIFWKPSAGWRPVDAYVPETTLSDHRPVVAVFERLPASSDTIDSPEKQTKR